MSVIVRIAVYCLLLAIGIPWYWPDATEGQLTRVGKLCSWILLAMLVGLAIALREQATLIQIIDRKFDLASPEGAGPSGLAGDDESIQEREDLICTMLVDSTAVVAHQNVGHFRSRDFRRGMDALSQ